MQIRYRDSEGRRFILNAIDTAVLQAKKSQMFQDQRVKPGTVQVINQNSDRRVHEISIH